MDHIDTETARTIRAGREAQDLLGSPTFVGVLNELSDLYLREIIDTAPHETKTREDRYLRIQVLRDITTVLTNRVALAEREQMNAETATYDPDTEET
jgi:hypothetical protein